MRKIRPNDALFPKLRQRILGSLYMHCDEWRYLSDLAQELEVSPSSLQREIHNLIASEILEEKVKGNRLYFRPNKQCVLFSELKSIVVKTLGLADLVTESLKPFTKQIDMAFIFGSIASGQDIEGSDVDLMVIGDVQLLDLAPALSYLEETLSRPVNPYIVATKEAELMLRSPNHFFDTVFATPKLILIKNDRKLARSIEARQAKSLLD